MADYKFPNGGVSTAQPVGEHSRSHGATTAPKRVVCASTGGAGKSRKVTKDIHDDLGEVDPDLMLAGLDFQFLGDRHDLPTNRSSSFKTTGSGQQGVEAGTYEKHRGRPIKPHEKEPFLTVGSQDGRRSQLIKSEGGVESRLRPKSGTIKTHRSEATPSSQGPLTPYFHSPYSSPTPSIGSFSARSQGQRSPSKMYVSPNAGSLRPNPHIKMPFKHSVRKPASTEPAQSPSQEMKEITALATYHVNRILAANGSNGKQRQTGRLLKGRLKPLYPVDISGATIQQCRGIMSESRSYSPSASRTLQRRRQIIMQLKAGDLDPPHRAMHPPGGSDSVHRVSAASSVAQEEQVDSARKEELAAARDEEFEAELVSMEKDALAAQEMDDAVFYPEARTSTVSREGTASVPEKADPVSRENTTLGPQSVMSLEKGLSDLPDPDFSTPAPPPPSRGNGAEVATTRGGDAVFLTQTHDKADQVTSQTDNPSQKANDANAAANNLSSVKKDSGNTSEKLVGGSAVGSERSSNSACTDNANNNFVSENTNSSSRAAVPRPKSAICCVQHKEDLLNSKKKTRPQTAASVTKAVRFAEQTYASDGSEIPLTMSASWVRESETTKEKEDGDKKGDEQTKTSRSSCKPADLESHQRGRKDDEDEDDGRRTRRGEEGKPPLGGITVAASSSKSEQSVKDEGSNARGTSSDQSQERTVSQASSIASSITSPSSLFAHHGASASILSVQNILLEADSRKETLSGVSPLPFAFPSQSPSSTAPTSTTSVTPTATPTPCSKAQQVQWAPGEIREGGGKAPRVLVPDGASLLKLLLEVASRSGEASISCSSVTHLSDSSSVTATRSDMTVSNSHTSIRSDTFSSHSTTSTHSDSMVYRADEGSDHTTTSSNITATNSEITLSGSLTPTQNASDTRVESPQSRAACLLEERPVSHTPCSAKQSVQHAQCPSKELTELHASSPAEELAPHPTRPTKENTESHAYLQAEEYPAQYDTVNSRVSVIFCKHGDTQKSTQTADEERDTASVEEAADAVTGRTSPRNGTVSSADLERSQERNVATPQGVGSRRRKQGPNRPSDLHLHFSLGFDKDGMRATTQTSETADTGSGEAERAVEGISQDKAMDGNKLGTFPGILKNTRTAFPASSPRNINDYLRTKMFRTSRTHYDLLTAELGRLGDSAVSPLSSSADVNGQQEQPETPRKTKGPRRMRQIFTHHSKEPFVYPSGDPFSSGVAMRLKYGDSPYLKEIKVPKQRKHPQRAPEKPVIVKPPDSKSHPGDHVCQAAPGIAQKPLLKRRRQHRVKFADFSTETLNVNQNCSIVGEADGGCVFPEAQWDEVDVEMLALCYSSGSNGVEVSPSTHCSEDGLAGDLTATDADDLDARFSALEAELAAVRSEIHDKILEKQAEAVEEDEACIMDAHDRDEDDDDDGFVYEDDGSSDDDEQPVDEKQEDAAEKDDCDDQDEDDMESYSSYYRDLLMAYRRQCMVVGEGSLVISDRLTWPCAYTGTISTSNNNITASIGKAADSFGRTRPTNGSHQAHSKARPSSAKSGANIRPESRCDSGMESDVQSDCGGRVFHRLVSAISTDGDSFLLGHSNRSTPPPAEPAAARQRKGAPKQRSDSEKSSKLEVIASSVPRSKPQNPSQNAPVAPFPPLCFAVNARAPPGTLFFFAYATYMNPDRLGSLLHRQGTKRYWAILFGFDLAFNKKSSDEEFGGLANMVFNPFASVEGCVFQLTPAELDQLDTFTSCPEHYTRVVLPVWMSEVSGSPSDLDLARYCVPAVTYIAQDNYTLSDSSRPNEFEVSQCLKSADILTPSYCDHLRSLAMMTSPASLLQTAS